MVEVDEIFIPQDEFSKGGWYVGPMFPLALMEYEELDIYAKVVWVALANCAGRDGKCYPSGTRIAKMTGISERKVRNCLNDLKEQGFIEWDSGCYKTSNTYRFRWHQIFDDARNEAEAAKDGIIFAEQADLAEIGEDVVPEHLHG